MADRKSIAQLKREGYDNETIAMIRDEGRIEDRLERINIDITELDAERKRLTYELFELKGKISARLAKKVEDD